MFLFYGAVPRTLAVSYALSISRLAACLQTQNQPEEEIKWMIKTDLDPALHHQAR